MKLRELAHSRAGDKGNTANLSLIAFRAEDYPLIREQVTAKKVQSWFAPLGVERVERYELTQLHALNFVLHQALGGGVTASTALDTHGKSLSSYLLDMEV